MRCWLAFARCQDRQARNGRPSPCQRRARPAARPGRTRPTPGRPAAARFLCDGFVRSCDQPDLLGLWQSPPRYNSAYRPGDNLFTNSTIAFDAATGKITWYFQHTANDRRRMPETERVAEFIIDGKIGGEDRKLLAHANRNGFDYRSTGKTASSSKRCNTPPKITWTRVSIQEDRGAGCGCRIRPRTYRTLHCPGKAAPTSSKIPTDVHGGTNFWPPAYGLKARLLYIGGDEGCANVTPEPTAHVKGKFGGGNYVNEERIAGWLRGGRPGLGRGQAAQGALLTATTAACCTTAGGIVVTALLDCTILGLRRPDAGGAVEVQRRLGLRRTAHDLHGGRQAIYRDRLRHRRSEPGQPRARPR